MTELVIREMGDWIAGENYGKRFVWVEDLRKVLEERREYKEKLIADLPEDYDDWLYDYHELCGQVTALTETLSMLKEKEDVKK